MADLLHLLWLPVCDLLKSPRRLRAENLFLRHQLYIALRRASPRPRLSRSDRVLLGQVFIRRLRVMGIRDGPISPRAPWQNSYVELLIGSVRRECLDHVLVFGEAHLRRILASYATYYNRVRTHLALDKNVPLSRAIQRSGSIVAIPVLGGLHHQYVLSLP